MIRSRSTYALLIALAVAPACEGSANRQIRAEFEHTIQVGDTLPRLELACTDGTHATIGRGQGLQIVTISTPGECSTCEPHMTGLERLYRDGRLPAPAFIVYWSGQAEAARVASDYRNAYRQPTCRDSAGAWFAGGRITHTPVTAVMKDGRILLLDDAPIIAPAQDSAFLAPISKLMK